MKYTENFQDTRIKSAQRQKLSPLEEKKQDLIKEIRKNEADAAGKEKAAKNLLLKLEERNAKETAREGINELISKKLMVTDEVLKAVKTATDDKTSGRFIQAQKLLHQVIDDALRVSTNEVLEDILDEEGNPLPPMWPGAKVMSRVDFKAWKRKGKEKRRVKGRCVGKKAHFRWWFGSQSSTRR